MSYHARPTTSIGHLKGKVKGGEFLTGLVVCGDQLGDAEIVDLAHILAFVYAGVKVNEVPAGLAGRRKVNGQSTLAIEAPGIAQAGIIID